ncbi:hypothetical protein TNCV_1675091 [Trichonephila clavipes]|nr:hypothetical protein TNCV_1675091 [Trichonephila clavipes]
MFSEALTHPLYTLNCTVLPPAFCDWLFNSEVEIVEEESDPVDDETGEDEDNNNDEASKGPSNADAFSALETTVE